MAETSTTPRPTGGLSPTPGRWGARRYLARLLVIIDVIGVTAAALAAGSTREALGTVGKTFTLEILPTLAMIPLVLIGLATAGCYRPSGAGLGADTFRRFWRGTAFSLLIIASASFVFKLNLSRLFVLLLGGYLLVIGLVFRWLLRRMARDPVNAFMTRTLVVGTDATSCHLAATLDQGAAASFSIVGFIDVGDPVGSTAEGRVLGSLDDLPDLLEDLRPDAVMASAASLSDDELRDLYVLLEPLETELVVYPSLVEVASRRLDVETAGPFPLLHLSTVRMTAGRRAMKRALDLVVASVATILSLPILLVAAIAVRLGSPGPAFFTQQRVGLNGKPFTVLKLRTMVQDAEDQLKDLRDRNEVGDGLFKIKQDPRITRVGRPLRRWSIDELPQLFNVLAGHMSLVGPRPALPDEVDSREPGTALRRHRLKPGITGHWQVSGRSEVAPDEALRMDLYYIENWSLAFDLLILAKTVRAVLTREGAY